MSKENTIFTDGSTCQIYAKLASSTGSYVTSSLISAVEGPGKEDRATFTRKLLGDHKARKIVYGQIEYADWAFTFTDYDAADPLILLAFQGMNTASLKTPDMHLHITQNVDGTLVTIGATGSFYSKDGFMPTNDATATPKFVFAVRESADWQ